ncbi:hypothetical protein GU926_07655 [Nibribacter ruber]|uniref:Uncharacterized protein n=1 Tax=Nibribacter ruber TaxID=2698458 RepID=A0A6P1P177_9BACT|nr:hypothetical protein [Nibribacter ruber]QHL87313.1 hypothetical protein GU926_07655 [Nibribacter ruber]
MQDLFLAYFPENRPKTENYLLPPHFHISKISNQEKAHQHLLLLHMDQRQVKKKTAPEAPETHILQIAGA